jgi:hypothetical protein
MQLNQPIPPSYSGGEDPYDFILKGSQKPKKSLLPAGNSRKNRVILVVGAALFGLILIIIVLSLVTSSGSAGTKQLTTLAQSQNEIIRISSTGSTQARDSTIKGFSESVNLTMMSEQQQTTKYLSSHGAKVKPKVLLLGRDPQTDATLKSATAAGRYDDELLKTIEKQLNVYKIQLQQAYKQTSKKSEKILIQQLFDQATKLTKNQPTSS